MIEKRIKTNGIELYVNDYERNGDAVVFIHCSSGNTAQWKALVPHFQDNYHVITADMRGHGKSDKPDNDYALRTMAKDILGIMDTLKVDKAHIVGSSMGAEIAVCFAADYPDRVLSIVCEGALQNYFGEYGEMDTPADQVEAVKAERLEKIRNRPLEDFVSMEEMLDKYKGMFGEDWNEYWEAIFLNRFSQGQDGKVTDAFLPKYLVQYCEDFYSMDFSDFYKRINCPVLFLPDEREAGSARVMTSLENFRKLLKKSTVAEIEKAEHTATVITNPKGFAKAIFDFWNKI